MDKLCIIESISIITMILSSIFLLYYIFYYNAIECYNGYEIKNINYNNISRLVLDNKFKEFEKKFEGKDIPRPSHWGGICLIPSKVEIWKSRDDYLTRLHDRIVFSIDNGVLTKKRLYP